MPWLITFSLSIVANTTQQRHDLLIIKHKMWQFKHFMLQDTH
ncbi:hypothetical protein LCAZH_0410 [Lacticaseibacillus paracasei]|uniref:Uncharacterized protein n=1 Tax=Lacticaseibacillus paracasei subsp. paracasei TaxID=47714 RepID=A0AAP9HF94_LACPA|nr:hypothetical protein LCAZH_0410 [Lacticaseibacillus paracasei]OUC71939.1 hypothetical protein BLL69_0277 [Lacticaseibacillus paracasei]OUC73688.1 hypothetical protein BWK52_0555 [Lacticaseibacillus paracasei]OUC75116.1 hypothetical protein B4Q23_0197 [Lacticaseibacillus paracasei]QGV17032.1 Hypothetical protein LCAKO_0455 [Lacticaseibacillus paracasei subsp. paracasei]